MTYVYCMRIYMYVYVYICPTHIGVMRGADCNTDHQLLRMKLVVGRKLFKHRSSGGSCKRYDVTKLSLSDIDNEGGEVSTREQFIVGVCNQMKEVWEGTTSIDEKWNVLRSALCDNAARFWVKLVGASQIGLKIMSLYCCHCLKGGECCITNGLSLD